MSDTYYRVILTGDSEHVESEAIATLARLFNKDKDQMKRLLDFTPVAIRKCVDQETAEQYQTILIESGMGVKIEETIEQRIEQSSVSSEETANVEEISLESDVASDESDEVHLSWSLEPTENDSQKPTTGKASFTIDDE